MNTHGKLFRLTTFGESHGPCIGGVIDGCPAGLRVDNDEVAHQLVRRRGGATEGSTARQESDRVDFVSGLLDGVTTGTPLAFLIPNEQHRSSDYDRLRDVFRPSHADYTYTKRYGIRDWRGGGRASARETAVRVVGGAIARQILREEVGLEIVSYTSRLGGLGLPDSYMDEVDSAEVEASEYGCPDPATEQQMEALVRQARADGDSLGGVVSTVVRGMPAGWGAPLYDKLSADLASAMMSINAAKGIEIGDGFALAEMMGREANDPFVTNEKGEIRTSTNHSGGIQGGISNGEVIRFRTAFKPIASIARPQSTVDTDGHPTDLTISGRHDCSVFPRVLPVVDAMTALVLIDQYLLLHGAGPLS